MNGFDMRVLGLSAFEMRVIQGALWSINTHGIDNFLPSPRYAKAARRMISMGFLSEGSGKISPAAPNDWVVVQITQDNYNLIREKIEVRMASGCEWPWMRDKSK